MDDPMEPHTWYALFMGNSATAHEPIKKLLNRFWSMYVSAEDKDGLLMLMHTSERDELGKDEINIYFSPGAKAFAESVGAVPCAEPSPDDLQFLGGAPSLFGRFNSPS